MNRTTSSRWIAAVAAVTLFGREASAQVGGASAGRSSPPATSLARLAPEDAGSFIAIEGSVELRLPADGLRVVFAIVTEAAAPTEYWQRQLARRSQFVATLAGAGLAGDAIEVDFINLLPVFSWRQETRDGQPFLIEAPTGHRLQENIHVAVADEAAARRVIELALANGVHDVVAVQYWSRATSAKRREALETALAAAKSKADLLLAAFATRPLLANIVEWTDVIAPEQLYRSFENVHSGTAESDWRRDLPRISAVRPRNTFDAGYEGDVDEAVTTARMRPEISIFSTVALYFESPAHPRTPPKEAPR